MLELSIVCIIAVAIVYWAALWLMGRHQDVLYGPFVSSGPAAAEPLAEPRRPDWPPELPRRRRAAATAAPAATGEFVIGAMQRMQPAPSCTVGPAAQATGATSPQSSPQSSPGRRSSGQAQRMRLPPVDVAVPLMIDQADLQVPQKPAAKFAAPSPAVNPGTLRRSPPLESAPPPTDVLASLLETIKRDISEATRR